MKDVIAMPILSARVPTANASKYIQQLCKHWSHRLEVDLSEEKGVVRFPDAVVTLEAASGKVIARVALKESFQGLTWSSDGKRILTGGNDGRLIVWDAQSGKRLKRFSGTSRSTP